jgi:hypothetical protein
MELQLIGLLVLPLLGGLIAAILIRLRGGASPDPGQDAPVPHRGPNASRIPLAGWPGLVVVLGYVWMFWSGLPQFRAIIVTLGILGVLSGGILVALERRHRVPSSTPLGLHDLVEGPRQSRLKS